ncbi:hypothetical protein TIFTF001_020178 [Ficus carica]|uniref:Ubiquitin-like protease family profile domain-containing protein n=1 Tax=Ficus carica TaxID=3494 RepID=A0AA88DJJ7_FICCA|nr:hypothetical protein TIFTF001_020178 [Ficus carica]
MIFYQAFVRDHIDEEAVWQRPSKVIHNYPTISQDDWKTFITYRRSSEFKRLSEEGSEIRKKLKYGSTRGRDGYRKRDQAHFEKMGKYAERHENWLNMCVKLDGSFKNEACKNIVNIIGDFNEQQTQGSFESVGTYDILTKALGNAEHSGRIRGQSKFFKQSQYFNVAGSYHENAETAPTVDQHNSFKASCTLNEKGAEASDPKTMPNASKECHLFLPDLINGGDVLVANDRAYMECALLPIPTHEATFIEEAVGGFVAWLKRLVIVQTSLSQASKGPSHAPDREAEGRKRTKKRARRKKIRSQPEVQQQPAYLADCCARAGMDQRFEFISLVIVSPVQRVADRAAYALNDWKISVGRGVRQRRNWETFIDIARYPIHEGYVECGYFVLAFMREITLTIDGLAALQTKDFYIDADMSLVRQEWARFVMQFIQY